MLVGMVPAFSVSEGSSDIARWWQGLLRVLVGRFLMFGSEIVDEAITRIGDFVSEC